jgi:hypothetical protein
VLLAEFPSPSESVSKFPSPGEVQRLGFIFFTDEAVPLSRREYSSPPPLSVLHRRGLFLFLAREYS